MDYIGARYVPKFMGTYDNTQIYEALSVVDNGLGTSYISGIPVPAGTPLTNTNYWHVYGSSSGAVINLQNQIDDLRKFSDETINLKELGAVGDGVADDTAILQNAVDNYSRIYVPAGNYKITSTIRITNDNVEVFGAGCTRWNYGSINTTFNASDDLFEIDGARSVRLHDFNISSSSSYDAIEFTNGSYTLELYNIVVKGAKSAVLVTNAWNYTVKQVIAEGCIDGFITQQGTSASFIDCIAYQSTTGKGFNINNMTYSSFINCGSDHCEVGFYLGNDNRGISFISCGVEVAGAGCFVFDGANIECSIIAPTIGDHSAMTDYVFKVLNAGAYVSIYDCKLATSFTPASPYGVIDNAIDGYINLFGCMLGSRIGTLGTHCANFGAHMTNSTSQTFTAPTIYSKKDGASIASHATAILTALEVNSNYIVCAQQVASTDQGNSAFVSIPSQFSGANVQPFRSSANCSFTVDADGNLVLSNDSSSNRNYYWSILKIS